MEIGGITKNLNAEVYIYHYGPLTCRYNRILLNKEPAFKLRSGINVIKCI